MKSEYARFRLRNVGEFAAPSDLVEAAIGRAEHHIAVLVSDATGFVATYGNRIARHRRTRSKLLTRVLLKSYDRSTRDETQIVRDTRVTEYFDREGWQVRFAAAPQAEPCLLIDDVAIVETPVIGSSDVFITEIDDQSSVTQLAGHFERLWLTPTSIIFEDQRVDPHVNKLQLTIAAEESWGELVARLAQHPDELRELSPRKFEEFVAHLLTSDGYDVQLTPRSKDGGRDILAYSDTSIGRHLFYVECKRYRDKPVGVEIVRALYGVVSAENATAGLLVTTSTFTNGALTLARQLEHRMSLKQFRDMIAWTNAVRRRLTLV